MCGEDIMTVFQNKNEWDEMEIDTRQKNIQIKKEREKEW